MMKLTERSLLGTGHTGDAYWWSMPVSETTVVCASHRRQKESFEKITLCVSATLGKVASGWLQLLNIPEWWEPF